MANSTKESTKDRICRTAWALFQKYGYEKFSLQMVADECGITRSNIYYYFRKKEDLDLELYRRYAHEFMGMADKESVAITVPWERFFAIQYAYLKIHVTLSFFRETYLQSAQSPYMREQYIQIKNRMMLRYVEPEANGFTRGQAFLSSVAISGAEIELLCLHIQHPEALGFREAALYSFRLRLDSLSIEAADSEELLAHAADMGEELYERLYPQLFTNEDAPFSLEPQD